MATARERLVAMRKQLEAARDENLRAVEDEEKLASRQKAILTNYADSNSDEEGLSHEEDGQRKRAKRKGSKRPQALVDVGSADEADGEDEDDRLRSMKRRARGLTYDEVQHEQKPGDSTAPIIQYGVSGSAPKKENVDRMVDELQRVEKRREKFRRRRAVDEDREEIKFINEGNRMFNRTLDKYFDKFESVKEIKDNLERGTA